MADLGGMAEVGRNEEAKAAQDGYDRMVRGLVDARIAAYTDPTQPPPHYKAQHRANGIEPGTEGVDVMVAFYGRDRAIQFLELELFTKALRLPTKSGDDKLADLFKIEQACAKLRGLVGQDE